MRGQRFGQWVIAGEEPLGAGGNGQVWRAEAADGPVRAIKVLSAGGGAGGRYRLGRFSDEIAFLAAHPHIPGILPLLDSHISDDPGEASWYVMPIARPIREALGSDPDPVVVVGAVGEIAATLASLAAEGVAHRDIKPDNLFELDGRWVIGDFGLVTYPDKDPRTQHGRKLGPLDYMAPEMRQDADRAAPGPADVWALGKTLWVLLTGAEIPLPGTHRPFEAAHTLRERITFKFAAELDLVLEQATLTEPGQRVSMEEMARELQACTAPPPEARPAASLAELHARAAALTAASREHVTQRQERQDRLNGAWQELAQIVAGTATELNDLLTFTSTRRTTATRPPSCWGVLRSHRITRRARDGRCFPSAISGPLLKSLWQRRSGYFARTNLPILPRSFESTGPRPRESPRTVRDLGGEVSAHPGCLCSAGERHGRYPYWNHRQLR